MTPHAAWCAFHDTYLRFSSLMEERGALLGVTTGERLRSLESLNERREQAWEELRQAWREFLQENGGRKIG